MEELKALVDVVSKNKVKQIDVIGNTHHQDTQVQLLYDKIVTGQIQTEEQIMECFFPNKKNASQYSKRLEKKLKDRLINTIFFIDVNQQGFNEYNKAYYSCYKEVAAVKMLIGRFARKAAIPLAERTIKKALEFELTDVILILAQELRTHYGTIEGHSKKFNEYDQLVEKYTQTLIAEYQAESLYARIRTHFATTKGSKPEIAGDVYDYFQELKLLEDKYESFKVKYFFFLTNSLYYEIINNYEDLLKISKQALNYFDNKKQIVPLTIIFSFSIRIIVSYIKLGKYEKAWEMMPNCLALAREGSANWFLTLEYTLILSFHSKKFQEAYTAYQKAIEDVNFSRQTQGVLENWRIHEAYIHYLVSVCKIKPDNNIKKFRINKFINEVPVFQKDKRGLNISILILQILFLLKDKKYGEIIDRTDSLKAYNQRYLRRDDTFRSNCFIQMLLTLPECSFHKKAVLRKAEKYWKKLQEVPLEVARQSAEIEIVPYEMLWEFVLESLDEKWH